MISYFKDKNSCFKMISLTWIKLLVKFVDWKIVSELGLFPNCIEGSQDFLIALVDIMRRLKNKHSNKQSRSEHKWSVILGRKVYLRFKDNIWVADLAKMGSLSADGSVKYLYLS